VLAAGAEPSGTEAFDDQMRLVETALCDPR
jgi:hypothetical protein